MGLHQIVSGVLSFFLSPFNCIVILLLTAFIFRRARLKKICLIAALVIFVVFGNQWLLNWYAKKWQPAPKELTGKVVYSCGIVPGGFVSPDYDGKGYFNATADRFIAVEKLFRLGRITHILISGGNGKANDDNFREGAWVKKQLILLGIPDSAVFVEDRSNDTFDNAVYAKEILDSLELRPPYLLITSAHHVPRASLLFRQAGLQIIAYPCNYINGRGRFSWVSLIPRPSVLLDWEPYLKETMGYWYYYIFNRNKK